MTESPPADPGGGASRLRRYGTFEGVFVPTLLTILRPSYSCAKDGSSETPGSGAPCSSSSLPS